MTDIKPDTSLYPDLPSRLRAMALVLEGPRGRLQWRSRGRAEWDESKGSDEQRVRLVVQADADYRIKPAPPAKLYVDLDGDGRPVHTYDRPLVPMPGTTRVTYVLEHPNAND